eukprot:TRINITY_DN40616_c0_g1_i1.p1 TRINITY_DN40616_c0_g1~~TRINITY_DN40616_c0_g1_i1.p1  ORF type:complete len:247 (+),score=29.70 TRINITY_DN40616_c0_g1_i1:52-792(+)
MDTSRKQILLTGTLLAAVASGWWIFVESRKRWRRRIDHAIARVKVSWLVDRIDCGRAEKSVPFVVSAQPPPTHQMDFRYRVSLASSGQTCSEGVGFVGVPVQVDLSRTGFGIYVVQVDVEGTGQSDQAEVEKKLLSFEEEMAKKPIVHREAVRNVDGWPSSGSELDLSSLRDWSLDELSTSVREDKWMVAVDGLVYDVSKFMKVHPGGVRSFMSSRGSDCTETYNLVHRYVDHKAILGSVCVGRLR